MNKTFSRTLIQLFALLVGVLWARSEAQAQQTVQLNLAQIRQQLSAPTGAQARAAGSPPFRLTLPTLAGARTFALTETHVLPAADTAARRRLRTFVGYQEGAPAHRIALVLTPRELTAQLLAGAASASLRPAPTGPAYLLRPEQPVAGPCATLEPAGQVLRPGAFNTMPAPFSFGTELRRLRYAILVTKEYYTANGNSDAGVEQAVVTAMNQMSGLYLREVAVSYELVKPTGGSYYFSAMSTATLDKAAALTPGQLRDSNLTDVGGVIDARFAASSFDLGHCFHSTGGGVAFVGVICDAVLKARAWSGVGTSGFQGVLAHEMGHQHGASHTFAGPCGVASAGSDLEPGGGATIMAYTDVCGSQTLQNVVGTEADHFNLRSLAQMRTELQSVSCPSTAANTNRPPALSAGPDYVIPRNTPFTLTATASDPDGEALYYTWNQFDYTTNTAALGSIAGSRGMAAIDDPEAPLFRPRPPRLAAARTFPDLRFVLANSNRPADLIGEALPNVGRDLHFVVTARDQRATGGTFTTDNLTLTVAPNAGPFALTCQNTDPTLWLTGQPATVTWAVNGTDQAPINVQQVRISLSTDGGQTFATTLAAAAPNTGSAVVQVPVLTTDQARIRVEAVGNVFFDINDADFPISACAPVVSQTLPATSLTAPAGAAVLNLEQRGFSLTEYTGANQLTGSITATDPTSYLSDLSGGSCLRYGGNITNYDTHAFVSSSTATYTISAPTRFSSMVLRVYQGSVFDPADPCQNLLADNFAGGSVSSSLTVALTAGQVYTVVVSNFGNGATTGGSYSLSFSTNPAGGTAYAPLLSLGFDYQYAVVNTATGQVVRLGPTADLRTLSGGTYDVYGLLFQRGYPVSDLLNIPLSSLQAALARLAPCGQLSTNARRVVVTGTLPVVLTRFTAQPAGPHNELSWTTASEYQVAYFEAQRSTDGRHFTDIGRVGATNGNSSRSYSLLDTRPPTGPVYYRLLMQDVDGQAAYSAVVALGSLPAPTLVFAAIAYPNPVPAGEVLRLEFQAPEPQPVEVVATDALGRVVLRRALALPPGQTVLPLPEARHWHGLYLLTTRTLGGQRHQQKVALE